MTDYAHQETDKLIEELEKELAEAYAEAYKAIEERLEDYLRRFEIKDEKWRLWVKEGKRTEEEYRAWRTSQILMQERWEALRDSLAGDLAQCDQIAMAFLNGEMPEIYALNHNWSTYFVEHELGMSTSYTLYNPETVKTLLKENPQLLPPRKVDIPLDEMWNMRRLQSTMLQGILQGSSIPELAKQVAKVTDGNFKNAVRNARTMSTMAQNSGREEAFKRAVSKGARLRQTWRAVHDMRTRHEHRFLDGVTVDVGEPFVVDGYELRFPGDPSAPGYLVYNCRCRLRGQVQGFERNVEGFALNEDPDVKGMTYQQWKESKEEITRPITHQADVAKAMRGYFYNKYKRG